MSYGYSTRILSANKKADSSLLGVALGRLCIEQDIPVVEVAKAMGVSRQTIYNWFSGVHSPQLYQVDVVEEYIAHISKAR
jgi:transcriptional regulator with XRE-family HTH domain